MGKVLIIPGVSVSVVKDVVPQQLAPSGVLGLVGFTGNSGGTLRAASWNSLLGHYGDVIAYSLPEARQALDNGVSELVVVSLPDKAEYRAKASIPTSDPEKAISVKARAGGLWANEIELVVELKSSGGSDAVDLTLERGGEKIKQLRNVRKDQLAAQINAVPLIQLDGAVDGLPKPGTYPLSGGEDASSKDYQDALNALVEEPDVDLRPRRGAELR